MSVRRRLGDLLRGARRRLGAARPRGPGWHRRAVGGRWDALGALQFDFLVGRGLRPEHRLLDVGCGSLRGGLHFIRYLQPGHYYGVEKEARVLAAGRDEELVAAGLVDRAPHLIATPDFDLSSVAPSVQFEFALAQSLFTHLRPELVALCMARVGARLTPEGVFYATYFAAAGSAVELGPAHTWRDDELAHPRYPLAVLESIAADAGLALESMGEWGHPRDQRMIALRPIAGEKPHAP